MRLLKLSLLLSSVVLCSLVQAQTVPAKQDAPIVVPSHSPDQLLHRFDFARFSASFLSNGAFAERFRLTASKQFKVDPGIRLNAKSSMDANTCFKLRKYIFQPKEQAKSNGMRPLGDEMQFVGETDCTYASKVWPKSADGSNPPRPTVGVQSTVLRMK
jgi:hypothetical protein